MSLFGTGSDPRAGPAAEEFRARLKENPLDVPSVLGLAAALAQHGGRRDAIALLSRTAAALVKKEKVVEAMALYKRVGELDPKGEVTSSFLVGLELKKLQAATEPAAAPAPPPDPKEKEAAAARRAKVEAVRQAAAGIPLLKDVPPFLLELVLDRVALRQVPAGTVLFTEGSEGSSILFVVAGEVEVLAARAGGSTAIARLAAGDVAGEISFLSGTPRTATLRAATAVHLLELDRRAFEPILKKHRTVAESLAILYRERVLDGVLARSRAFGALPPEAREAIASKMTPRLAKPGELLIREGATDDALFLIRRGQARVTRRKGPREAALAMLGPHDVFGDVAALRGTARTATVTAVTPMELLTLPRAALVGLLPGIPGLAAALEEIQLERYVRTAQALAES